MAEEAEEPRALEPKAAVAAVEHRGDAAAQRAGAARGRRRGAEGGDGQAAAQRREQRRAPARRHGPLRRRRGAELEDGVRGLREAMEAGERVLRGGADGVRGVGGREEQQRLAERRRKQRRRGGEEPDGADAPRQQSLLGPRERLLARHAPQRRRRQGVGRRVAAGKRREGRAEELHRREPQHRRVRGAERAAAERRDGRALREAVAEGEERRADRAVRAARHGADAAQEGRQQRGAPGDGQAVVHAVVHEHQAEVARVHAAAGSLHEAVQGLERQGRVPDAPEALHDVREHLEHLGPVLALQLRQQAGQDAVQQRAERVVVRGDQPEEHALESDLRGGLRHSQPLLRRPRQPSVRLRGTRRLGATLAAAAAAAGGTPWPSRGLMRWGRGRGRGAAARPSARQNQEL